jgi:hypothetical protein
MRVIPERTSWIRSEPIREVRTGLYWCLRKARDTVRFRCFSHSKDIYVRMQDFLGPCRNGTRKRAHTLNHASERLY